MRLPNRISEQLLNWNGNRRNKYQARVTVGFTDTGKQIYKTIGYFKTRKLAIEALSNYHTNPYDIDEARATFKDIYEKWSEEHFKNVSDTSVDHYQRAFRYCKELHNMRFVDIKTAHLQGVLDKLDKNYPTKRSVRLLMSQLFHFAIKQDLVEKEYPKYVTIGKANQTAERKIFTKEEIDKLFKYVGKLPYIDTILIMIFTCMRVGELLTIENKNVFLKERYMIGGIKTVNGKNRIIPINKKILPFIEKYYNPENKYLINNEFGEKMTYQNYRRENYNNIMEKLKMNHTPHECRHTGISLLDSAGANPLCVKRIVGHSARDITADVYTHKTLEELIETIDLI